MTMTIERTKDETDDDAMARAFIKPNTRAAFTINAFTSKDYALDIGALVKQLKTLCNDNNFNANEMLIAQAQTLDAMFNNLAQIAAMNLNNPPVFDALFGAAMKAQNQCGKTLQVISQNQLMNGAKPNASMDTSTTAQTIEGNKTVATLEVINGGKKSESGKKKVSQNAYKGGLRPFLIELANVLRQQRQLLNEMNR